MSRRVKAGIGRVPTHFVVDKAVFFFNNQHAYCVTNMCGRRLMSWWVWSACLSVRLYHSPGKRRTGRPTNRRTILNTTSTEGQYILGSWKKKRMYWRLTRWVTQSLGSAFVANVKAFVPNMDRKRSLRTTSWILLKRRFRNIAPRDGSWVPCFEKHRSTKLHEGDRRPRLKILLFHAHVSVLRDLCNAEKSRRTKTIRIRTNTDKHT